MAGGVLPVYVSRGSPVGVPVRKGSPIRFKEKYVILICLATLAVLAYTAFLYLPNDKSEAVKAAGKSLGSQMKAVLGDPKDLVIPPGAEGRHAGAPDPHPARDADSLRSRIHGAQIPVALPASDHPPPPHNPDPDVQQRRDKIKSMMKFAWDNYKQYAWGANELRPVSKTGHSASIFGQSPIGATIVDAIDTLWLMGLKDEYEDAKKWIEMSFDLKKIRGDLSVFETNIRFLGGLLSIYALTKEEIFKQKAMEVGKLLLPAFNTPTGIPLALVNSASSVGKNWGWASGGASILAEYGSLHLEFHYLSDVSGDPIYLQKVTRIREVLNSLEKQDGLYPNYLNPRTGKWGARHVSIGALGDSFYEYLIKSWLLTRKNDTVAKTMFDDAVKGIESQLLQKSKNGLTYFAELRGSRLDHKGWIEMDHLGCFIAGMFALNSEHSTDPAAKTHFRQLGAETAHTCHESYIRSATGIGPESFRFTNEFEAKSINQRDQYYILRPEVIEGWFYMWRLTGEQKYRDWAWAAAESIEKHCKAEAGYSGIRNVYDANSAKDDVQQSFFLAETLKYLYLIFADDVLPLSEWVMNTEAHPLPVRDSPTLALLNASPPPPPAP